MSDPRHIYVALPVMDELERLPATLAAIAQQSYPYYSLIICVNQPEIWWHDKDRKGICQRNQETLSYLQNLSGSNIETLDRSSPGMGWQGKRAGVGWARKTVMDRAADCGRTEDVILSLDADTTFHRDYFSSVISTWDDHPDAMVLAVPYYHMLPDDKMAARMILRYEIYMRYYFLNLWRIRNPYAFTALGSAMVCSIRAYRSVGGMTPKHSGEDFYFLQKLRKAGKVLQWNDNKVFPAARFSSRVHFGTGPAMIRGSKGDWNGYPVYPYRLFDEIKETCDLFPVMLTRTVDTPVVRFLAEKTGEPDPFQQLRTNFKEPANFVRACHEKLDGLRILQYLKKRQKELLRPDEENLLDWFKIFYAKDLGDPIDFSFSDISLEKLDQIRNFLVQKEDDIRKQYPLF